MRNFLKAFFSFGLATSIQKLLGFVILPIYTRYFNKVEYGIIDMTSTMLAVFAIFGLLQLETALQRYYYECQGVKRKLLVTNIYMWVGVCSTFIGALFFAFSSIISLKLFDSDQYGGLLRIASIQLPISNFSMLGLVLLRFEKENSKFLKVILVNVVFSLLFVYLFVIKWDFGLSGVFYAQLGAVMLSTMLVTFYVRHLFVFRRSKLLSRKNFKYALPQFPARVGSMVLGQANRFFMLGYLSLGAIGIYSVSMKLASSIQLVNTAFILAWAPLMHAQFKNKNNKEFFANIFPLVVGGTFFFVCLITLFSKEMVMLLATEEFYSSYKYVGGLSFFFSLYIIKETVDIGPKFVEKTKYLSYTFLISVIVNITALYVLIQFLELKGVVFAMMLTNLVLVGMSWFISNRLYYIPFSIVKFFVFFSPAFILAVMSMYYDMSIGFRITITIFSSIFYGVLLFKDYMTFKQLKIRL